MKNLFLLLLIIFAPKMTLGQYHPTDHGSQLTFVIKNLGFDVNGSFSGFKGNITFDPQNLSSDSFDVTIDAATVNTDNSLRDSHLKDNDFFDVKNYPTIHLVSVKISSSGKSGQYQLIGKLTIKKTTQDISFPFTASPNTEGLLFKGSFKIKRRDFGVGGISTVSDDLVVSLSVAVKK